MKVSNKRVFAFMAKASQAYYAGEPIITNEEYDALERTFEQLLVSDGGDTPHFQRMYSLQKHYVKDGTPPLDINQCVESFKLDGAAISLLYTKNSQGILELTLALTRGDGIKGRNITDKAMKIPTIPFLLEEAGDLDVLQVTGEVVAWASMPNARNYASGALNLKDIDEFVDRVIDGGMIFVPYDTSSTKPTTYLETLDWLQNIGFCMSILDRNLAEIYPTDGMVYRLNNNAAYTSLGYTNKFPRGAFALKEEQEGVETTLLDVIWQTGKSGKVTPIALLEPVKIGDATISRATLNNIEYIRALNLEIGCRVLLIRSGEIIPKIIGRVDP